MNKPMQHLNILSRHPLSLPLMALIGFMLAMSNSLRADTLAQGADMPHLTLPDQHGKNHSIGHENGILLFAPDRGSAEIAGYVLKETDPDNVERKGLWYISDISAMPPLVTRMFALPKMRKFPYRVLLGYKPEDTVMLSRKENHVTILNIRSGKIERIRFAESPESIAEAITSGVN